MSQESRRSRSAAEQNPDQAGAQNPTSLLDYLTPFLKGQKSWLSKVVFRRFGCFGAETAVIIRCCCEVKQKSVENLGRPTATIADYDTQCSRLCSLDVIEWIVPLR